MIGTLFASRLIDPELAPAAIDKAFRLYMLPQGMFSVAVATVLFPALSRLAARDDIAGFARTLDIGLRQIGFLLVPAGIVSAVLAEPIVRLVYQRGEFTPEQTPVVAGALAAFSVGLVFNGWMLLLNRAFYSLQSNWIPTLVALGNLVLNVALFAASTARRLGHPARDLAREPRGRRRALRPPAAAGGSASSRGDGHGARRILVASAVVAGVARSSGGASTRRSDARSWRRSSRSGAGSPWGRRCTSVACRVARRARARLALRPAPRRGLTPARAAVARPPRLAP